MFRMWVVLTNSGRITHSSIASGQAALLVSTSRGRSAREHEAYDCRWEPILHGTAFTRIYPVVGRKGCYRQLCRIVCNVPSVSDIMMLRIQVRRYPRFREGLFQ